MITKTSVFCQKMLEKTVVKDAYSPQKIKKAVIQPNVKTFEIKLKSLN